MSGGPTMAKNTMTGEERLIERLFRPIATHPAALGLKDDAALLAVPAGRELVLTADMIVCGVHFFDDDPPDAIAKKALRVNLSDLAAKGADPTGVLLSLSVPASIGGAWLQQFADGLRDDCEKFGCPLLGGDMTRTAGPLTVAITALGTVPEGQMVQRRGAQAGDALIVTGTIGDAALGLELRRDPERLSFGKLDAAARAQLTRRYLLPMPRGALASALRMYASAAIDISDGLAGDVMKLASASGVGARIDAAQVPLSPAAKAAVAAEPALFNVTLTGGDDYEIAAAVPEKHLAALRAAATQAGIELTTIGRIVEGEGVEVIGAAGEPIDLPEASFSHFPAPGQGRK
jgi:thiamine-monophosphate kinase